MFLPINTYWVLRPRVSILSSTSICFNRPLPGARAWTQGSVQVQQSFCFLFLKLLNFSFFNVVVLPACVSVHHVYVVPQRSEKYWISLELGLQMVLTHHVDAGTWDLAVWKSSASKRWAICPALKTYFYFSVCDTCAGARGVFGGHCPLWGWSYRGLWATLDMSAGNPARYLTAEPHVRL